jgi:hypothetical protein
LLEYPGTGGEKDGGGEVQEGRGKTFVEILSKVVDRRLKKSGVPLVFESTDTVSTRKGYAS